VLRWPALWAHSAPRSAGATAIGPLAGGLLTDTLGWRSIFFINLPIGVAAFVAGAARLRESRNPAGGRADWGGIALITGALTALMFALIRGNSLGWGSTVIVTLFAVAAVAFVGFVFYELRVTTAPMADLRLFRRRNFAATGFVAFAISVTVIGMIIYLSLYVQTRWASRRFRPDFGSCHCRWPPSRQLY